MKRKKGLSRNKVMNERWYEAIESPTDALLGKYFMDVAKIETTRLLGTMRTPHNIEDCISSIALKLFSVYARDTFNTDSCNGNPIAYWGRVAFRARIDYIRILKKTNNELTNTISTPDKSDFYDV